MEHFKTEHYAQLNKQWEIEGVPAEERSRRLKEIMAQDRRTDYNRYDRERWERGEPYGPPPV